MASIGELFIFLGFKVDDAKLKDFDKGLKSLSSTLDLTKIGAIAAIYEIDRFIESSVAGAVAIYNFTQQTNESAQALQSWQAAAHSANPALGIDQIAQSIQTLENNLVEIRKFGSGNASPFAWLKIDIAHGQNAIDVLEQLRERVQTLDRVTAVNLIQKMGLNPGFINILTRSKKEFDEFVKSATIPQPTIEKLQLLGEKISNFKLELSALKSNIVSEFAPIILQTINTFEAMGRAISYLADVSGFKFSIFVKTVTAELAILTAAFFPITSAITAFLLLLEDFAVYKKGGKSLFGEVFGDQGESFTAGSLGAGKKEGFVFDLLSGLDKIKSGELHKNYTGSTNNSSIDNKNAVFNNTYHISSANPEDVADSIVLEQIRRIRQLEYNQGLTDQTYKGSGY